MLKDGVTNNEILKSCEISLDELDETIREHGVEDSKHVKLAILEVDGNVSVISLDNQNNTQYTHHKRKFPRKSHKL